MRRAIGFGAAVVGALVALAASVDALTCYNGIAGSPPYNQASCSAGMCTIVQGTGNSYQLGCNTRAACEASSGNPVCCSTDLCNSADLVVPPTAAPPPANFVPTNFAAVRTLVFAQSAWRYLDDGSNLSTAWRAVSSFDDSAWSQGRGPFGYNTSNSLGYEPFMTTVISSAPVTTYFRHTIPPINITSSTKAIGSIMVNGGAVVYINGIEVHTTNLPTSGPIVATTVATSAGTQPADYYYTFAVLSDIGQFLSGTTNNVIQVEVHRPSSATVLAFDFKLVYYTASSNPFPNVLSLVRKGAQWKYRDVPDTGTGWRTSLLSLDKQANGPFGANTTGIVTIAAPPPSTPTLQFVATIANIPNTATEFTLNVRASDGFIAYLNGVEILRVNMPASGVNETTAALSSQSYRASTGIYRSYSGLSLAARVTGGNFLAVEVHMAPGSTSVVFDLEATVINPQRYCTSFDVPEVESVGSPAFPLNHNYSLAACVSPFLYNGQVRTGCITTNDKPGGAWCAITSNYDIDGVWGYCNPCVDRATGCKNPFSVGGVSYSGACVQTTTTVFNYLLQWCLTPSNAFAYCGAQPVNNTELPSGAPTSSPTPEGETGGSSAVVGAAVGASFGFVAIAGILFAVIWFTRRKSTPKNAYESAESTVSITPSALPAGFGGAGLTQTSATHITQTHVSTMGSTKLSGSSGSNTNTNISGGQQQHSMYSVGNTKTSVSSGGSGGYRPDFQGRMANVPLPLSGAGGAVGGTEMTVLNTQLEKSLPGFLMLSELSSQIRLGRVINAGAAGTLYEGFVVDPNLRARAGEERVAVKTVRYPNHTPEQALEAFHHEITAMWSLSFHPNVVKLIAFDDATTSMVQPLYDGDLDNFLHKNPDRLNLDDVMRLHLIVCVAKGMAEIHNLGIVHRDLKCANVLLRWLPQLELPEVVIIDFGIARIAENHKVAGRREFDMFGLSPRYAAPEAFARYYMKDPEEQSTELQKKSDVYSFGVMVWEILCRRIPWDGMTAEQIQMNVRSGVTLPAPAPPMAPNVVQSAMTTLWRACSQKDPQGRPGFALIVEKLGVVVRELNNQMLKTQFDQKLRK